MKVKLIALILFSSFSLFAQAPGASNSFCQENWKGVPIQQGGRIKPLYVHAEETLKYLTGKKRVADLSAVQAYCLLSLEILGGKLPTPLLARIDHVDTRKFLELGERKQVRFDQISGKFNEVRMEYMAQKEDTSYKKSLSRLLNKIHLFNEIRQGQNWLIPHFNLSDQMKWAPVSELFQTPYAMTEKLRQFVTAYEKSEGTKHLTELTFAKMRLPAVAMGLSFLALAVLALFRKFFPVLILSVLSLVVQLTLIVFRVHISGRAPITNMYETVMFSGFGALVLALIIGHFQKRPVFVYVGLAYNAMTLFMMNFSGGMLNDSIGPLVPVLRDNFWLSTHVTTVILSYGALALSWIMANTALIRKRFFGLDRQGEKDFDGLIYTCLKFGVVLLAAGVLLGGVWADYSWGRFWGWDPKETWSLIVLCLYMAILHGKYTAWIPTHRFIPLTALAFLSVMMAWFGVNYILASGLHSYGFSEGGAIFLGVFFLTQIAIVAITWPAFGRNGQLQTT